MVKREIDFCARFRCKDLYPNKWIEFRKMDGQIHKLLLSKILVLKKAFVLFVNKPLFKML